MATRAEEERIRQEQTERFLKQLTDMFAQTRTDLAQQFMPRNEAEARMEHTDQALDRMSAAVEKVAGSLENVPRIYAEKAETKQDLAELRTEIEKLKTARESDMQRGYGYRIEDIQGRYKGDIGVERAWRNNTQQQAISAQTWMVYGMIALVTIAANIILAMALHGH